MNALEQSSSEESDSYIEIPRPKKRLKKEDSDWEDDKHKGKPNVKTKAAADKPTRVRKPKPEKSEGNPKTNRKPKVGGGSKTKASHDVKPEVGGIHTKSEENGINPAAKGASKRKRGNGEDVKNVKKLKAGTPNGEAKGDANVQSSSAPSDGVRKEAFIVAKNMNCSFSKSETLIQMLNDGATIPFLIRYRKNVVGDWSPTEMRLFRELHQSAKELVTRAAFVKKKIAAKGHLNERIIRAIDEAKTMAELEDIYEPYKPAKVLSKLAIVRDLGLDSVADRILGKDFVDVTQYVNPNNEHTKTMDDFKTLMATALTETILRRMTEVARLWREDNWTVHCAKVAKGKVEDERENFRKYYDFRRPAKYVRADEVLAMNRGAKKKILKITMTPSNNLADEIKRAIVDIFKLNWLPHNDVGDMLNRAITMAQEKLLAKIPKKIRADSTRSAEAAAIEVFNTNLKRLLLTPPYRSDREFHVLGIDPGKRNGCKIVVVNSKSLTVEEHVIMHLFPFKSDPRDYRYEFERNLIDVIRKWGVEIVIIGNGLGCQEVENVVNNILRNPEFSSVRYTVIPEQGVSVYSVSEEAQEEYPDFKPEVVSSLSLVKRFFNPLHEYVKVDPKHLGVGMYQHDIDDKKLTEALQETVSEIVSVVGVDLNAASTPLLKSVAGLTDSRAKAIIAHRNENGSFKNRKQLLEVKGIGPKTYQQCAGFVRIIPPSDASLSEYNLLDQTIVHPENYATTHKLVGLMGLSIKDIGSPDFISTVKNFSATENVSRISEQLGVDVETTKLLFHALSMSLNQDIRTLAEPPDFKTRLCSVDQLREGMVVTGRVENVTTFGAFVDIGTGVSGLLHFTSFCRPDIGLGDRIEVFIDKLEVQRQRISLSFKRKVADLFPMSKLI